VIAPSTSAASAVTITPATSPIHGDTP
jgi:hypothetical protein